MQMGQPTATDSKAMAKDICAWSKALILAVNDRDWDFANGLAPEFVRHLSPTFRSQSDITSQQGECLSLAGQIAVWQQRGMQHPQAHFEIISSEAELVSERKATVFITMRVHGVDDVVLLAMNEFQWSCIGSDWWQCDRLVGLRGSFWNSGGIG